MKSNFFVVFLAIFVTFFLSSCATVENSDSGGGRIKEFSKVEVNAKEFGKGEFLSTERTIRSITIDNRFGHWYEFVVATVSQGNKEKNLGFYRTKVIDGESIEDAADRVQTLCHIIIRDSNIPYLDPSTWYNADTKKVSCLLWNKDNG